MNKFVARADFSSQIARAGFSKRGLADAAGVNRAVLFRLISPNSYDYASGQVREKTAWAIAKAYAKQTGIDEQTGFDRLFERASTESAMLPA